MEQADVASHGDAEGGVFGRLLDFLSRLDEAHIFYALGHTRPSSVIVEYLAPGLALGGRVQG